MAYLLTLLAHCPLCKYGMDEIQARAMEVSIYFLLVLLYSLVGAIVFMVCRTMSREERELRKQGLASLPSSAELRSAVATPAK
jgi:hypothetical protein